MVTLFLTTTIMYNVHYHQNLKLEMKLKNVFFYLKIMAHPSHQLVCYLSIMFSLKRDKDHYDHYLVLNQKY